MNWEVITSVGQWVGTTAVVATVFYLALQIRQQNVNTSIQMQDSILDSFNGANQLLAGSKELTSLFVKGLWSPDDLDDDEASQFQWIFRLYANTYFKIYRLYEAGALAEGDWQGHSAQAAYLFGTPGGKLWIQSQGDSWGGFFDAFPSGTIDVDPLDITLGRRRSKGV